MAVNTRIREGVTILDIEGRIIGADSLALKRVVVEHVDAAEEGEVKILLNLGNVGMVDASGLGVIVLAYTKTQRKGGRVALLNVSPHILTLIVEAKLVAVFDHYEDEDEALASFQ